MVVLLTIKIIHGKTIYGFILIGVTHQREIDIGLLLTKGLIRVPKSIGHTLKDIK
jgi:hypothetical protein